MVKIETKFAIINSYNEILYYTIARNKKACITKYLGVMADLGMTFKRCQELWGLSIEQITIKLEIKK